jgi:hypothetical protein
MLAIDVGATLAYWQRYPTKIVEDAKGSKARGRGT